MIKASENVVISKSCKKCSREFLFDVPQKDLEKFMAGMYIQRAFPYLKPEQRELFLSGYCSDCWDELFKEEDDV